MNLLLRNVLFRLPSALPDGFFSISFDYEKLSSTWGESLFSQSSPNDRHLKRQQAERIISRSSSLWSLIAEILPSNTFEEGPDWWGISISRWAEWLGSLWACDSDAICLLACPSADIGKLPVVWAPANSDAGSHDAHIHLSALPPNSLLWTTTMALGVTADSGLGGLHAAFSDEPSMPRLKEVSRLARVILHTLRVLEKVGDADLPRGFFKIYADAWNSVGKSSMTEVAYMFQAAFPALERAVFEDALTCSNCFGVKTSMDMLSEERRIVALTLTRCRRAVKEWSWLLDLLVLYWQCKGEWLKSIQGDVLQTNSSLFSFREQAKRAASFAPRSQDSPSTGLRERFDHLLTSGFQEHLSSRKDPLRFDLRIALSGVSELRATSMWLDSGLAGSDVRLFIGLKRRDDMLARGDREFAITEGKIDAYFENLGQFENIKSRLCGIDVFGFEATTCWADYLPLMRYLSDHVRRITGDCVITFHCGEDPVCSLKGILDMWRNVNYLHTFGECRISHALALLNPQSYQIDTPIDHRMWNEMQLAANQLIRFSMRNEGLRDKADELERLWSTVEAIAIASQHGVIVPSDKIDMAEVFERFRQAIAEDLIARGVIIEVCPTSNWRIGHVSSPTRHPIRYWHDKGGKWLVGTDDPCFIPCSVESEAANLALSLQ